MKMLISHAKVKMFFFVSWESLKKRESKSWSTGSPDVRRVVLVLDRISMFPEPASVSPGRGLLIPVGYLHHRQPRRA